MAAETIREMLSRIDKKVAVIETHCTDWCAKVAQHDVTLYGNGKTGLTTQVWALWGLLTVVVSIAVLVIGGLGVQWIGGG